MWHELLEVLPKESANQAFLSCGFEQIPSWLHGRGVELAISESRQGGETSVPRDVAHGDMGAS